MHVLHRSHLSRPVAVSVAAAIIAIVITLAFLAALGAVGSNAGSAGTSEPLGAPAPLTAPVAMAANPFGRLLSSPPALRWGTSNAVVVTRARVSTLQ